MQNTPRHFISGFSIVAASAGLISVAYSFFTGTAFYLAVIACFLLVLCCVVAWQKTERARYVNQSLRMIFDSLSENVDGDTVFQLVEIVAYFGTDDEVATTLQEMIYVKIDPTERYWVYIALGMIGGKKAEAVIRKGLTDDNEFARNGAQEAAELLRKPQRRAKRRGKLLRRYATGKYISSAVTLSLCAVIAGAAVYHKNLGSKPPSASPSTTPMGIVITRGKGGDIWINICTDKGDFPKISITPSRSLLHLKIRM
ncbi:MAG: hypothetical protein WBE26_11425 [Phycisphaerae bacterium]